MKSAADGTTAAAAAALTENVCCLWYDNDRLIGGILLCGLSEGIVKVSNERRAEGGEGEYGYKKLGE